MRSSQPAYASLTRFSCVVLSYSLLLSFCAPFHIRGAAYAPARRRNALAATPQGHSIRQRLAHRDGQLIVRFRQNVSEQEKEEIVVSQGAKRGRRFRGASRLDKLTLPAGHHPEMLAAELRLHPAVEFAEPNYLITRNETVPDDPRFGEQWALKNTGNAGGQATSDVGATRAWEVTTGAASTVIAVIDSGIDFTHPDLRRNQWTNSTEAQNGQDDDGNDLVDDIHGWDWVTDSNVIRDEQGHGTVIAGLIAAQGNNTIGMSGVMWRASVMSLRVLDATGTGDVANAVEAIDYAVAHGARVINCSWGMDAGSAALKDAFRRAARRGVLIVCSAGNDGRNIDGTPYYPASFELENLIAVASTDNADQLTTLSNWGATRVHVGAPGENILSTKMGGGYKIVSGSSASAPIVAGVAGLVMTLRPYLSAKITREMILAGVRPVETLTGKVSSGGVINAAGTLSTLHSLPPDEGLNEGDEKGDDNNNGNNSNGGDGGNGNGNGRHRSEQQIERTKGAPGLKLPNLDEVRRLRPAVPGAPAPIRSNLAPDCAPNDPDCAQRRASNQDANTHPTEVHSGTPRATFVKTDTTTQGNWKGKYGTEGYALVGDAANYPAYVQVSVTGAATHTWTASTPDVRALQKSAHGSTDRIAATWYSSTVYSIELNLTDGQAHQVAMYSVDWDYNNVRAQKVEVLDGATGALLDSRDMLAYTNGQYVVWSLSGHVKMKVGYTGPAGLNAVTGGLFFDPSPAGRAASATFLRSDTTTQGNWKGVYGGDGYQIINDSGSYPAYAQVNPGEHIPFTWVASTDEVRAPQKSAPGTDRIAACWYSYTSFSIDLNLTDGQQHQVALYALDWDGQNGRSQRIDILDADTGTLLDSQNVSAFSGGHYVVWNLSGHVIIKVTRTGIHNAVISGLFFAASDAAPTDPTGNNFSVARLDPANRTGQPGTDLFSGNYNWGVSLAGLRGRAGLDLNLSLSYNSLVWTRDNAAIKYDADRGTPGAGFRLGFPVIESRFYHPATNKNTYLMITPSGERVELRQVGSSNVYEADDSSYLQLVDNGALALRTTNGTQLSYVRLGNLYLCTQIRDRNGNFITVNHNRHGGIQTITDTLGRTVTFNYDGNNRPISITQTWNGSAHAWVTFGYGNILLQPGFSGLSVLGPQNKTISVLTQVGFADGTSYNFEYAPAGQVSVIRHYAADGHQLSYTAYDFDANGTDCPRVVARRDFAEDWNNGTEAVTTYADEGGGVRAMTMPDRTTSYKEFFGTAGWLRGLVTRTETWSGGGLQKWTTTEWTQDDPELAYQLNPRPVDSSVYDAAGNRRRTTIAYTVYGLPRDIREYGADGWSVLRRAHVDYKSDALYLERRLIGLPEARLLYEGESTLVSKTDFHYDWGGEYFSAQSPSMQHDGVSYGSGYLSGRGNLSAVRRFNKDAPDEPNQAVWQQRTGYNVAGLPVFARDADGHTSQVNYSDDYAGGHNTRNTLAYPTKVTDAGGSSSTVQYNYDLGVVTRSENPQGMIFRTTYDSAGRVERVTNETNGAYTRFVYGADNKYVQSFSLLAAGVESYSLRVFDGAGRVRATAGGHPGSAGGYRGKFMKYDVMGRAVEQTNAAEISAGWLPAGDDAAGWVWRKQAYDWKGRPTITTNADLTTREASYGGCGCAGGEVVTLRDEMGRRERVTADVLGRAVKSEDLNADGSVYRTTTKTYNALDQVSRVFVQAGTNGAGQETLMTYDGYGRLATQKAPVQTSATQYAYNADDTLHRITDARGVAQTMHYNARHLVTKVSDDLPAGTDPQVIPPTGTTTFGYDAAGRRVWMADDAGRVNYTYNTLSQLTAETRQFAGLAGSYTLRYSYNLAGQVQSVTDPTEAAVTYDYDAAGRLSQVTGTPHGGVSHYAVGMQYRAFGALKSLVYGNGHTLTQSFDVRQQLASLQVGSLMSATFAYDADGQIRCAQDHMDATQDRAYGYDHVGRLAQGLTGAEARDYINGTQGSEADGIYRQTYQYDEWDNLTGRAVNRFWSGGTPFTDTYLNGRKQGARYDAAGHVLRDNYGVDGRTHTHDAAGHKVKTTEKTKSQAGAIGLTTIGAQMAPGGHEMTTTLTIKQSYDGEGQSTRREREVVSRIAHYQPVRSQLVEYYVRSSVLGGRVVTELNAQGRKVKTNVYAGSQLIAEQHLHDGGVEGLIWKQRNPVTGTEVEQQQANGWVYRKDYDPFGLELGDTDPYLNNAQPDYASLSGGSFYRSGGNPFDASTGCEWNGEPVQCTSLSFIARSQKVVGYNVREQGEESGGFAMRFGLSQVWRDTGTRSREIDDEGKAGPWSAEVTERGFYWMMAGTGFFQQPQQATQVMIPVGDLKKLIQDRLKYGDCNKVAVALIKKAGELSNGLNDPVETDILKLYELVKSQPNGGINVDVAQDAPLHIYHNGKWIQAKVVSGGGGASWGNIPSGTAILWIYQKGGFSDRLSYSQRYLPMSYGESGIHELIHLAGKNGGYSEELLSLAAKELKFGATFEDALRTHCIPQNGGK